jgi:hypothetical protein
MEFYAGAVPEELERLKPEERRRVYGMLRFEVSARAYGTLEARGILGENLQVGSEDGRAVCDPELAQSCVEGWRMQRNILRLQAAFPFGTSPVIEPPVPPLLEPGLPQPIRSDPGLHVPFCELLHELVVRLAVAR